MLCKERFKQRCTREKDARSTLVSTTFYLSSRNVWCINLEKRGRHIRVFLGGIYGICKLCKLFKCVLIFKCSRSLFPRMHMRNDDATAAWRWRYGKMDIFAGRISSRIERSFRNDYAWKRGKKHCDPLCFWKTSSAMSNAPTLRGCTQGIARRDWGHRGTWCVHAHARATPPDASAPNAFAPVTEPARANHPVASFQLYALACGSRIVYTRCGATGSRRASGHCSHAWTPSSPDSAGVREIRHRAWNGRADVTVPIHTDYSVIRSCSERVFRFSCSPFAHDWIVLFFFIRTRKNHFPKFRRRAAL